MIPYLLTLLVAASLAFSLSPAVRRLGAARGRSRSGAGGHSTERPRIGGIVIFAAFAAAPWLTALVSPTAAQLVTARAKEILGLTGAASLVFAVGFADDRRERPWQLKLAVQIVAAALLYLFGYRFGQISLPWGGVFRLGPLDPVATILWLVFITNALNLIDGRDGVAGGVAVFAAGSMALVAYDLQHFLIALLFAALAGATIGFLPLNLPTASHFLGDSGALLLGFLLAALSISGFVDRTGRVPLTIPIVALGLPILDALVAFSRRACSGHNPFAADLDHLHDRVERVLGAGPRALLAAFYALAFLLAASSAAMYFLRGTIWLTIIFLALILLALGIVARLGYFRPPQREAGERPEDELVSEPL